VNTIFIFRLGSLGDTIITLPFFHRIAELYPNDRRIVLTNIPVAANAAPLRGVLDGSGLVHDYISYPIGLRSPARLLELARTLARTGSHTLIYMQKVETVARAYRDFVFFRLCGFRNIIGAPLTVDLQQGYYDPVSGVAEPECERLARCLARLGPFDLQAKKMWDLHLTLDELAAGHAFVAPLLGRPVFAINMGGKAAKNDWGHSNWCELIRRLTKQYAGFGLLAIGAAQDAQRADEVGALWSGVFVNACGRMVPRVSAAALGNATLFIGHDSGPLHLAAAMGIRCVGLYGDNNPPKKWHPYFGDHEIIHNMKGVRQISVDDVISAVDRGLGKTGLIASDRSEGHAH